MPTKNIMPTTYLLISVLAMLALQLLWPAAAIIPPLWNLLGIVPLALGVIVNLLADSIFHQVHTTVKPFVESSVLVTGGVFRVSRNPMYLGFVLVLIGIALLMGSLTPWMIIAAFVILLDRIYITVEERMLAERFRDQWTDYKRSTRRWL